MTDGEENQPNPFLGPGISDPSLGARILLLETDEGRGEVLRSLLRSQECRVRSLTRPSELPEIYPTRDWDVVFCDLAFVDMLLPLLEAAETPGQVILLAHYDDFLRAQKLVATGRAFAWLPSPLRTEKALETLREALRKRPARAPKSRTAAPKGDPRTADDSEPKPAAERHFGYLLGESEPMQELYHQIGKVADSEMTVLILGESGTGKELVAKSIHAAGSRSQHPFVPVNCSSLPENLLESELFGYVKGAFTGALHNKDGLFVAANGGTLFLDEIGSIPPATQMALLRVLQEREVRPVGATKSIPVDVRVVTATNEDVERLKDEGRLRLDLFYRISAFTLRIPPLRDRGNDLELLADEFLKDFAGHADSPEASPTVPTLSQHAQEALRRHAWPGNVRELVHALERGATLAENGVIHLRDLPEEIRREEVGNDAEADAVPATTDTLTLKAFLRVCERQYLQRVLEKQGGDKERAARVLGISVATIYRKLSELA